MSKVAVMMSEDRIEAPISAHFGKAEWTMVADTECHTVAFLKNDGTQCKSLVQLVADSSCTDAIFSNIGNGALAHLQAASIHGWLAPRNITGRQALQMFEHLRLQSAGAATEGHAGGCCHSQAANSEAHTCCQH